MQLKATQCLGGTPVCVPKPGSLQTGRLGGSETGGEAWTRVLPALAGCSSPLPGLHWCTGTSNWSYWLAAFV